jgi:hypothetical protein
LVRSRSTCHRTAGSPSSSQSITLMTADYPAVDPTVDAMRDPDCES